MNEFQNHWAITAFRRLLFGAVLLLSGVIWSIDFRSLKQIGHPYFITDGDFLPIVLFIWGMPLMNKTILAVWLVTRSNVWNHWQGWLRAGIYSLAFAYGIMLFESIYLAGRAMQPFHLPGANWVDYYQPTSELVSVLLLAWLLAPMAFVFSTELSAENDPVVRPRRFSILGLIGYITTAAILMGWIQLITSDFAPWDASGGSTTAEVQWAWLGELPYKMPDLLAAMLLLFGLSKRWWWAVAALPAAIVVSQLTDQGITYAAEQITGAPRWPIIPNTGLDPWIAVTGRMLFVWVALGMARLLGVKPYFGGRREEVAVEPENEVSPLDAKID
ncbi:hypothetical protein GC197_03295 [bacterium]|nr:hypothetical protein [bacterium]